MNIIELSREKPEVTIKLLLTEESVTVSLPFEEYVTGVVLAEMPASFEIEALKAQAVCARTFIMRRYFSPANHLDHANICDDIGHCQAYISIKDYLAAHPECKWAVDRVKQAVTETRGQVITFQGQLIEPVYHSTCGGHTENSLSVWGNDHPYLRGVKCHWDSKSPYYHQEILMSLSKFRQLLSMREGVSACPQEINTTENGTVSTIAWSNIKTTGQKVRQALRLPSARFTIAESKGLVTITTSGYGHGVGLCQYGSNGMASNGYSYQEILHYYYQGIKLYLIEF
ncbi:MAG: stage II sporulation protein D [Syntrophomonadaceae bacterium]|nr:stage II sporulation protein D [Syntrophomonadaceae bacterium]